MGLLDIFRKPTVAAKPKRRNARRYLYDDRVRALVLEGKTAGQIAEAIALRPQQVYQICIRLGLKPGRAYKGKGQDRAQEFVQRYEAGENASQIAAAEGITRERVCQLIRPSKVIEKRAERKRIAEAEIAAEATAIKEAARRDLEEKMTRAVELVRDGRSIAQACIDVGWKPYGNHASLVSKYCKQSGFQSQHGRWHDFSPRIARIRELRATGMSLRKIRETLQTEGDSFGLDWVYRHVPEIRKTPRLKGNTAKVHAERLPVKLRLIENKSPLSHAEQMNMWPDHRTAELIRLWLSGNSAQQIVDIFGPPYTRNSIIGKISRLREAGELKLPSTDAPMAMGES